MQIRLWKTIIGEPDSNMESKKRILFPSLGDDCKKENSSMCKNIFNMLTRRSHCDSARRPCEKSTSHLSSDHEKNPSIVLDADAFNQFLVEKIQGFRFLIPGKMAFLQIHADKVKDLKATVQHFNVTCFSSDLHRQYTAFCSDFGPVNLSIVYRFCKAMRSKLAKLSNNGILLYCIEATMESLANASFLLASYLLITTNCTPEAAAEPFTCPTAPSPLQPFRDATFLPSDYHLSLLDCLRGLSRATALGWFSIDTFDLSAYQKYDNPLAGDLHRIAPCFVAFKGPLRRGSKHKQAEEIAFPPEHYVPIFHELGVDCVVRLNDSDTYDASDFTRAGIHHRDLYFDDCTVPPDHLVRRFLDTVDAATAATSSATTSATAPATVAVHCRAGLGRTGTLIALWMMKHAGFSADGAIGWLRIVRPGSVIGPQQHYLRHFECCRGWDGNTPIDLPPRPAHRDAPAGGRESNRKDTAAEAPPPPRTPAAAADGARSAEMARQVTAAMARRDVHRVTRDDPAAAAGAPAAARPAGTRPPDAAAAGDLAAVRLAAAGGRTAGVPAIRVTSQVSASCPSPAGATSPPSPQPPAAATGGGGSADGRAGVAAGARRSGFVTSLIRRRLEEARSSAGGAGGSVPAAAIFG